MNQPDELLSTTDLLLRCWQEIQNRFKTFFLLALVGPFVAWLLRNLFLKNTTYSNMQPDNVLLVSIISLLIIICSLWATTALVLFICKRVYSWGDLIKQSLLRLPRVVAGLFLYAVLLSIYTLLVIVVIVLLFNINFFLFRILAALLELWLMGSLIAILVYTILLPYVLILTDIPLWMTLPSAFTLVRFHWWKTFSLLLVLLISSFVISILFYSAITILSLPINILWPSSINIFSLLKIIPSALILLIYHIPMVGLYVNLSYWWQIRSQIEEKN